VSAATAPLPRAAGAPLPPDPIAVSADLGAPPVAPATALRLGTFSALAVFCGLHWASLIRPASPGRVLETVAIAIAAGIASHLLKDLPRAGRNIALAAVAASALILAVLASGVPVRLLAPAAWGELGAGLGQGIQALPGITVPYRGVDAWVRIVILAGGAALLLLAALLAARAARARRPPLGAAVVLATVYAIAVVEHTPHRPFLGGAAFAVLLGALLWADRVERPHAAPALVFVTLAALGGMVAGPSLDGGRPWIDYERIAEALTTPPVTSFDWNHGYGPLHWPRDGHEVLRIQARTPAYWKATDLDTFDGVRWRAGGLLPSGLDSEVARGHPEWRERLVVDVRNMRSTQYVGAGVGFQVRESPRQALQSTPGTFVTGNGPLRRGDSYVVDVYTPRPSVGALSSAGVRYPAFAESYLSMDLPHSVGGPRLNLSPGAPSSLPDPVAEIHFPAFGLDSPPFAVGPGGVTTDADGLLVSSDYGRVYLLAKQLRAQSRTPYQYVRAVEDYLSRGFSYTETPPRRHVPLASFLLDDKAGYCQQFSGAMALLLRMAGIPARVSSGFTSGTFDSRRNDWVIRDLDAHSWVEAYFPSYGWVTFDPTPQLAPPRGQLSSAPIDTPGRFGAAPRSNRADVPRRAVPVGADAPATDQGSGAWTAIAIVAALLGLLGALAGVTLRRARRVPAGIAPELAELERALRWTGRHAEPPLTLIGLESRFGRNAPDAAAYVAAVRGARYAGRSEPPTEAQRAALRRELAFGLGPVGRARAWLALPPRRLLHLRG
jgi:transglutaminase-like putative cysteine protease